MDSYLETSFLNPLLALPWTIQNQNYEKGGTVSFGLKTKSKTPKVINHVSMLKRNENIEALINRFPGLKKYQARAALTMSRNKLDKAVALLEVSKCYNKEVETRSDLGCLRQIAINFFYSALETDLAIINITLEHASDFRKSSSSMGATDASHQNDSSVGSKAQKVGVIIKKTTKGYQAFAFDEN